MRRDWSAPASDTAQAQAGQSSDTSGRSPPWTGRDIVGQFTTYLLVFGLIGFFFSSRFPIALGLLLFLADDRFIEWTLQKVGIRLIPDTLGPEFIKAWVFLFGLSFLLAYWKDSAPAWLLPWFPPGDSWSFIVGGALACAVLQIISTAVVRRLLPQVGIEITPDRQGWAILVVLGVLIGSLILAVLVFAA